MAVVAARPGRRQAIRRGNWKGVRYNVALNPDSTIELYDLSTDISETTNVAAKHPELVAKLTKFAESAHTPIRPGEIYDRALMDKDHNKTTPKTKKLRTK